MPAADRNIEQLRQHLQLNLNQCRQGTLALFARLTKLVNDDRQLFDRLFFQQSHPEFSPIGWHLGHIAYVESIWILQKCAGLKVLDRSHHQLYAADGMPKCDRIHLPTFAQTCAWLDEVRTQVWQYLANAPLQEQERLWRWLLQHESYHSETIAFVAQMHYLKLGITSAVLGASESTDRLNYQDSLFLAGNKVQTNGQVKSAAKQLKPSISANGPAQASTFDLFITSPQEQINQVAENQPTRQVIAPTNLQTKQFAQSPDRSLMVEVSAGSFWQGSDAIDAFDNERSAHLVEVDRFWIDRYPITRKQFQEFMGAGGYQTQSWWSAAGWQWLQSLAEPIDRPLYWDAWSASEDDPVCGVSWYEADAYARFAGKRLPTESEWEKAAAWRSTDDNQDNQNKQGHKLTYPWSHTDETRIDQLPKSAIFADRHAGLEAIAEINHATELATITHYCNCNSDRAFTTPVDAYPHSISPAGCYDMLGNVWEWTATSFYPYPGFNSFPYQGYSGAYFDRQHFVLKGGSWASRPWLLRSSTRNWYYAYVREILAGFRCAYG
jgi:iron(II)-dependent oxidoreductase